MKTTSDFALQPRRKSHTGNYYNTTSTSHLTRKSQRRLCYLLSKVICAVDFSCEYVYRVITTHFVIVKLSVNVD